MLIGAHVRTGGSLLGALERAKAIGADVVQVFTQSPRTWKRTQYAPEVLARYREAQAMTRSVAATFCHASYLVNLATSDELLLARSRASLVANLTAARGMGASGLVVHVGSHRGRGFDDVAGQVADVLRATLDSVPGGPGAVGVAADDGLSGAVDGSAGWSGDGTAEDGCPILLENAAGAGGSVGRTFEELADLLERADAGGALGVCLDTQHLWASGVPFGSPAEADDVVAALDATVGLAAVRCLHLNDSKTPFGGKVDRHANLGEGTIGEKALGCLIGHPAFAALPAVLEVPGAGEGPTAADVAGARRVLEMGQCLWERAWGVQGPSEPSGTAAEWEEDRTEEER